MLDEIHLPPLTPAAGIVALLLACASAAQPGPGGLRRG